MKAKANFAMAIHFHQPVGNFDHVIKNACDKCYLPFLKVLKKYPLLKMNLHFTGCLLEWVEDKDPVLFSMIGDMAGRGQIEILSGGFYEPILPSIPSRDRLSQIHMLSEYIQRNFHQKPQGAWVAERVWEPTLASDMFDSGIKYVIMDDTHFIYSGISRERLYGYYVTEDNGKTVNIFPADKELRYCIPYKMPEETINYMKRVLEYNPDPVFVYADDGEKFGEWPGTYDWVYGEKWLENFFNELVKNESWLETTKLSDILEKKKPLDRVYLSTASYEEMLQWALPANSQEHMEDVFNDIRYSGKEDFYRPFIRGGFWRNFLTKYPESNNMNKKMIYVSNKLERIKSAKEYSDDKINEIEKYLLRGQCNCAYWHGVFGGLYLFHLRNAIYYNLIRCERSMDELIHRNEDFCEINEIDIDADGSQEIIMENRSVYLCFDPGEGGALKELDSKKTCHNYTNSLARRKEAYHRKILEKFRNKNRSVQERNSGDDLEMGKGIDGNIYYDWYNRYSFLDHFISKDADLDAFSRCQYHETGDFVKEAYCYKISNQEDSVSLLLKKDGWVSGSPVCVEKKITLAEKGESFTADYSITNTGKNKLKTIFGVEFNITLPFADSENYSVSFSDKKDSIGLREKSILRNIKDIKIFDVNRAIFEMSCDEEIKETWTFPVRTVSQSEKAYELNYQSTVFMPLFCIELDPKKQKAICFRLTTSHKDVVSEKKAC